MFLDIRRYIDFWVIVIGWVEVLGLGFCLGNYVKEIDILFFYLGFGV